MVVEATEKCFCPSGVAITAYPNEHRRVGLLESSLLSMRSSCLLGRIDWWCTAMCFISEMFLFKFHQTTVGRML